MSDFPGIVDFEIKAMDAAACVGYRHGYLAGLEKARELYRERITGQCKMFSRGDECDCFLCAVDNLLTESKNP